MVTLRKNSKTISLSVSFVAAAYLKDLSRRGINASREVEDLVRATPGFKKFFKTLNEKN